MAIMDNDNSIECVGGWGGLLPYTPKADDVIKLTKLAKEQYGIDPNGNIELFDRLLDLVYGNNPQKRP